jgi:hypothetical protein
MEQTRTIKKLMIVRTLFNESVSPTNNLYETVKQIINLNTDKVILHPSDRRRVFNSLFFFIQDVNIVRLNELFASNEIRWKKHLRSRL